MAFFLDLLHIFIGALVIYAVFLFISAAWKWLNEDGKMSNEMRDTAIQVSKAVVACIFLNECTPFLNCWINNKCPAKST